MQFNFQSHRHFGKSLGPLAPYTNDSYYGSVLKKKKKTSLLCERILKPMNSFSMIHIVHKTLNIACIIGKI